VRQALFEPRPPPGGHRSGENGAVRTVLLGAVFFILGIVTAALWFHQPARPATPSESRIQLSAGTKAILDHLDKPVEIRFYSLLDAGAPAALREFSGRIDQLLSAYQQAAGGKLVLAYETNANANAALADGIKGFNLDKGEGCYLGIALVCAQKKEALPQLSPEWETAVEADISRAIARVTETVPGLKPLGGTSTTDAKVIEEVKQIIPNPDGITMQEGTRILTEAARKEFAAAASEGQNRIKQAEARVLEVGQSGPAADRESAMNNLRQAQAAQAQKLEDIVQRSQSRIDAFKQLKLEAK
jgi:hypothetical protein